MLRNWGRGHAEDPTGQRPAELVFVLGGGLEHTHVYATSHSYPAVCKAKCSADRSPFNEGKCGGSSNSDYRCLETEHGLAWAVCAEHEVLGFASPQHMKNALYRFSVGRKEISLRSAVLDTSVMTPRSVLLSSGSSVASGTRHAEDPAELITRKTLPNNDLRNSSLLGTYST